MARTVYRTGRPRWALVPAGFVLTAILVGCGGGAPEGGVDNSAPFSPPPPPPVYYVDPDSEAAQQVDRWKNAGRTADAETLRRISARPSAKWLVGGDAPVREEVDAYLTQATVAGQIPVLVIHNVPDRDCGRQDSDSGGAATGQEYQRWIRDLAGGIKGRPVSVVLEPGAVPDAVGRCVRNRTERLLLLRDAVAVLKSTGAARVYLDAGHPGWISDTAALATTLRQAGIDDADGFALNVANFVRTPDNVRYGQQLSDALGGDVRFVIDTSRNGTGPVASATVKGAPSWCNPPGRALGEEPTDAPGLDRVDALLWIKYPGESDGACRPGEPERGVWWPEYALALARNAAR
ncbi:glycoside hydrolase family 6 protein [Micromonospora pallida]|uniref:glycoside hydrolase family 6 protein n=1 Tax=Micromonospora pallida TaxID=145854 RepID=UPI001FE0F046|nr:glycoside hydrolase family 6 protein [Micromonospora pallida]